MNKILKNIINYILSLITPLVKDETKIAGIYTLISKLLFDKKNNLEYSKEFNSYWLKHDEEYLFLVKAPYYNFSKKNLYKSIFDIYCKNYSPKANDIIIDIGAGIGTETLFFHEKIGLYGKIYSIEASTDSYNKLNALCSKNKISNSTNFNIAISNFCGKIWIEETENFEVNQINIKQKGIEINCFTLDQFIIDNSITSIDLLKVNIEGAEYEMIDGMKESIKLIENVAISCHDFLFTNQKNIKDKVISFLQSNNFEITLNNTDNKVTDSWVYGKRK